MTTAELVARLLQHKPEPWEELTKRFRPRGSRRTKANLRAKRRFLRVAGAYAEALWEKHGSWPWPSGNLDARPD